MKERRLTHAQLKQIQASDPDGHETEPTEADYAAFEEWVTERYGPDAMRQYKSNWDS